MRQMYYIALDHDRLYVYDVEPTLTSKGREYDRDDLHTLRREWVCAHMKRGFSSDRSRGYHPTIAPLATFDPRVVPEDRAKNNLPI